MIRSSEKTMRNQNPGVAIAVLRRLRSGRWRRQISAKLLRRQLAYVKGANGPLQALQIELAELFRAGDRFDGDLDPAIDQDLPVGGLRTEPRPEIHHGSGRRIVEAAFVADIAQSGMARRYADAEAELVAEPTPLLGERRHPRPHFHRHANRALRRIGTRDRIVEDDEQAVTGEMLQRAVKAIDLLAETAIVFLQDRNDVFRLGTLGKGGEPAQVAEHRRDVAAVALQQFGVAGRDDEPGNL